jgi:hypothetical protein
MWCTMDAPANPDLIDAALLLPRATYPVTHTLRGLLPLPITDTPEDAARRDLAAIAHACHRAGLAASGEPGEPGDAPGAKLAVGPAARPGGPLKARHGCGRRRRSHRDRAACPRPDRGRPVRCPAHARTAATARPDRRGRAPQARHPDPPPRPCATKACARQHVSFNQIVLQPRTGADARLRAFRNPVASARRTSHATT